MSDATTSNGRFSGFIGSLEISMFDSLFLIKPSEILWKVKENNFNECYAYIKVKLCQHL